MDALFWSIVLLLAGIGLIGLEIFIPSGGVLSILSVLAVVASIVVAFAGPGGGSGVGLAMLTTTGVVIPLVLAAVIRWWPSTPIGRMIVLHTPESEEEVLPLTEEYQHLKSLIGRRGVAKTKMYPSGVVLIDGEPYDAVGEGMAIEPGQPIRVIAMRTNRIVVTVDTEDGPPPSDEPDVLAQPADSLGIDSLEDPPA
jgi:membrane-bound serine protease (ClpP class)